ncbi:hypothetical protein BAUCODRAFT_560772 [Baudoinia panamericana UAMH 10762]|uniref:C2H2-type domain-containing protein n=1 Tax=Baudoinia panamericana (strain UAMH 10762) TaxID=717646 RepID=M2MTC6_BAUPA|nr:uncharacterized protein BAUCODRAFT_560772 [Baudoinia panamericana UAMH 10762]EMC94783.1 hypothetical protein BAUCODRAFT_560772 [Baudoinia panamericana UAMH 10762]
MILDDGEELIFTNEALVQPASDPQADPLVGSPSEQSDRSIPRERDPGQAVIVAGLSSNCPDLVRIHTDIYHDLPESATGYGSTDSEPMDSVHPMRAAKPQGDFTTMTTASNGASGERYDSADAQLAARALQVAKAASSDRPETHIKPPPSTLRVDSAQETVEETISQDADSQPRVRSPLRLQTAPVPEPPASILPTNSDSLATSPNLSKHVIALSHEDRDTLPVVQRSRSMHDSEQTLSPTKLPSFQQFTGQLNQLAEAAASQELRAQTSHHQHSNSVGSMAGESPRLHYHHSQGSAQTSPVNQYAYNPRSPTSTISDFAAGTYGSPTQQRPLQAYFAQRRRSSVVDSRNHSFPPVSLPSVSSSGESQGHATSSGDGYSTSHTTPIEHGTSLESTPRPVPILPPPPGMPMSAVVINPGFNCDYPGCNAAPFQTQYLLTSHKNVHSSERPHYCPRAGCPRGEGGKGFKRKNEMLRHELVHNSPGYVCPFCQDKEHRYPRPDNLQRHVRVHHMDKDKEDPALREVLSQRLEGIGKQRRRRTVQ